MTRARRAAALVPLLAAGCQSQWYPSDEFHDIVRTNVVIRTQPSGAQIDFDGKRQPAPSPIRIPVAYDRTETLYERQTNYGADMREGMSTGVAILTSPVWLVASLLHHREELRRHEYGGNRHTVTASREGYEDASEEIVLEGQAERDVTLTLTKAK